MTQRLPFFHPERERERVRGPRINSSDKRSESKFGWTSIFCEFFFLSPLGATIASVYETARFTMPGYASFLWGAGQAFIGFLVSYTRVLATLWHLGYTSVDLQTWSFVVQLFVMNSQLALDLKNLCVHWDISLHRGGIELEKNCVFDYQGKE